MCKNSVLTYGLRINIESGRYHLLKVNHATVYLSGTGAKAYNNPELYTANLIELTYTDFTHPHYLQQFGSFESHLSILDVLFNLGFKETSKLFV